MSVLRIVGAMDPVAVDGAGPEAPDVAMPDSVGMLRQDNAFDLLLARFISKTQSSIFVWPTAS
jgi:hypothetical protein